MREFGTGKSRMEAAQVLGLTFQVTRNIGLEDGISAARLLFRKCWFDEEKTQPGREALQHYRRDYNQRLKEFTATPVHDWASHGADAFRGLAVRHKTPVRKKPRRRQVHRRTHMPGNRKLAWMG